MASGNPVSFADYPMSVTEKRALKDEGNASKWTPRDALISMLRRIDSGEIRNLDALVIVVREKDSEGTRTFFSNASPDFHTTLGMLEHVKLRIYGDGK